MAKVVQEVYQCYKGGVREIPQNANCRLFVEDGALKIEQRAGGLLQNKDVVRTFTIPGERLLSIEVVTRWKAKEKQKSVIGRGIVGGLVLGPVGAVVGGMSGIGTKQDRTPLFYMDIQYRSKDSGIVNTMVFQACATVSKSRKFADYVTESCIVPNTVDKPDVFDSDVIL